MFKSESEWEKAGQQGAFMEGYWKIKVVFLKTKQKKTLDHYWNRHELIINIRVEKHLIV